MSRTRARRWVVIGAAGAAVMLLLPPTVGATVIQRDHKYSVAYSDDYDDCGFPVHFDGVQTGSYALRVGKGDDATAFFEHDNFAFTETHTNPDTGAFMTITANANHRETKATRVEGNVFEFKDVTAGQTFTIRDSTGRVVSRERGNLYGHVLFDTEGNNIPGGILVEDLGTDVHGPHPTFEPGAFCSLITPLIGS